MKNIQLMIISLSLVASMQASNQVDIDKSIQQLILLQPKFKQINIGNIERYVAGSVSASQARIDLQEFNRVTTSIEATLRGLDKLGLALSSFNTIKNDTSSAKVDILKNLNDIKNNFDQLSNNIPTVIDDIKYVYNAIANQRARDVLLSPAAKATATIQGIIEATQRQIFTTSVRDELDDYNQYLQKKETLQELTDTFNKQTTAQKIIEKIKNLFGKSDSLNQIKQLIDDANALNNKRSLEENSYDLNTGGLLDDVNVSATAQRTRATTAPIHDTVATEPGTVDDQAPDTYEPDTAEPSFEGDI